MRPIADAPAKYTERLLMTHSSRSDFARGSPRLTHKLLVLLTFLVALVGCDIPRPSRVVCDCQVGLLNQVSDWASPDRAPLNYNRSEIRALFDIDVPQFHPSRFDTSDIHWYRNGNGESLGCVVFDSSNHVSAMFHLSADASQTSPVDYRLMGIPFGRDQYFWEGC